MRAVSVALTAVVGLVLASCGGGQPGSQAKAAADLKPRDVIVGAWKIKKEDPLDPHVQGYDFAADNTVKVHCLGTKDPISGKYVFLNDYTIEVEYDAGEEAKKAYADAVKAYKNSGTEVAKQDGGKVPGQIQGAMAGMFGRIPDQLPEKETLTVIVKSVQASGDKQAGGKPGTEMIVKNAKDFSLVYRKEE
jgi:hypothetical protein